MSQALLQTLGTEWGTRQCLPMPAGGLLPSRGRKKIGRFARVERAVLALGSGGTAGRRIEVGDQVGFPEGVTFMLEGRRSSLYRDSG